MDLIATLTLTDLVAGVSFSMMFGVIATAIALHIGPLWQAWIASPIVQAAVNTTLVVLQSTEVVWKPLLNASLVVLRPISNFALMVLKPFGPLALVLADNVVRGLVLVGFATAYLILTVVEKVASLIHFIQSAGLNVTTALQNAAMVTKDFAFSLYTIVKGVTYVLLNIVFSVSFVIECFEELGKFLNRIVFHGHVVTREEMYSIALPFSVVISILGFVVWRAYKRCAKPSAPHKKCDDEPLRRSSRIARKRAMLLCSDSDASFTSQESSTSTTNL